MNLRAQVDDIESQNSRMIQEETNYKKLYQELKRLQSHVKVDTEMQNILIKGDYKDDEQLQLVCEALEALKVSMDPSL